MPLRISRHSHTLVRIGVDAKGKATNEKTRIHVLPGKPFDFTDAEIKAITASHGDVLSVPGAPVADVEIVSDPKGPTASKLPDADDL